MIWDILLDKLEAAGIATRGQDLYLHTFPAEVSVGVMLKAPLTGVLVDPHIPGFHKPNLQAIVRHTQPELGETLATRVSRALTVSREEFYLATAVRGRVRLAVFYPRQLPIQYPRLDGNTIEWSLNFTTAFSIQSQ